MDGFSSSPLTEAFPINRFSSPEDSPAPSPTRTEVDLPADVDESFNSSMSISTCDSPPAPSPSMHLGKFGKDAFDSPTAFKLPPPTNQRPLFAAKSLSSALGSGPAVTNGSSGARAGRALGPARSFGRELSVNSRPCPTPLRAKGRMLPPAVPEGKMASPSRLHATSSQEDMRSPRVLLPRMGRRESEPVIESPFSRAGSSKMDVDSPAPSRASALNSPAAQVGSPGLEAFFCESPAPPLVLPPAKRRNISPPSPGSPSSSPSTRRPRCDRTTSTSALLFGNAPRPNSMGNARRPAPYALKRPGLQPVPDGTRSAVATSAYPILCGKAPPARVKPMRRAYSVCDQPTLRESDDESDLDASPSVNLAEIRRRYGKPALPRVDGSPQKSRPSPSGAASGAAKAPAPAPAGEAAAFPEFGVDELQGKILPCHTSRDDRLVRITADTLRDVVQGRYNDKMRRYHIIDCRFDYEYEGGHIEGAINISPNAGTQEVLDQLFLSAESGINQNDGMLPTPSHSGQLESSQQVVLIFHCEFSLKRAPKVAGALRTLDRKRNDRLWPKVHYPELYILEGGYCNFFKKCPTLCEPRAYIEMNDPRHLERCSKDLNTFDRVYSRTRSLPAIEFGRLQAYRASSSSEEQPSCPPIAFAAASAAAARRCAAGIMGDADPDSSPSASDASPCPRAVSMGQAPIFGSARLRTNPRGPGFQRHASFADALVRR